MRRSPRRPGGDQQDHARAAHDSEWMACEYLDDPGPERPAERAEGDQAGDDRGAGWLAARHHVPNQRVPDRRAPDRPAAVDAAPVDPGPVERASAPPPA